MAQISVADKIWEKLNSLHPLDDEDRTAIRSLLCPVRTVERATYVLRDGEASRGVVSFLISGFAFSHKLTRDGARQIVALHLPGDLINVSQLFVAVSDHNVQAMTTVEVAEIPRSALQALVLNRPNIARAIWADAAAGAAVTREWVLNVGRRDARARVAHMLCEFTVRMQGAGLASGHGPYVLPMTQEQWGDAVGLTSVHVNRTLRAMVSDGLIRFERRTLFILDWPGLQMAGEFTAQYLDLTVKLQTAGYGNHPATQRTQVVQTA